MLYLNALKPSARTTRTPQPALPFRHQSLARQVVIMSVCWGLGLILAGSCPAAVPLVDSINPIIGASTSADYGEGKTFPGAATPFGLVQLSPDTITGGDNGPGYSWEHKSIEGFSFTHLSGVGWYGDLGNFEVMPTTGKLKTERGVNGSEDGFRSRFHHETEIARAGYYAVTLDDYHIRAEMTATPRAGILRFTFPESDQSRLQIDLAHRTRNRRRHHVCAQQ